MSLVYARYHDVVDVIAGVHWAAVTLLVAPRLHVAWERWRAARPRSEGDLVEAA